MIQLGIETNPLSAASLAETKELQVDRLDKNESRMFKLAREVGQTIRILAKTTHLRELGTEIRFDQEQVTAFLSGLPKGAKSEVFLKLLYRYYGERLTLIHSSVMPNEVTAQVLPEETKSVKTTSPLHRLFKYDKIQVRD